MKIQLILLVLVLIALNLSYAFANQEITNQESLEEEETEEFNKNDIATRLRDEMALLEKSANTQNEPTIATTQSKTNTVALDKKVDDLEEKINFRAAAVKKEDNFADDEVSADDLDGEMFR